MWLVGLCVAVALFLGSTQALAQTTAPTYQDNEVDLLLVLAADVSRSVDAHKYKLQRDGYANAIMDKQVLDAIRSGPNGRIALAFVEWSGFRNQKVVIDWKLVGDAESAYKFATGLLEAARSFADRTSISGAIDFSVVLFPKSPYSAPRRVIDISGDGTNNAGRAVEGARDNAVAAGIVINGIVILSEHPLPMNPEHTHPKGGLEQYYRDNVIGGPGSFVIPAKGFPSFGEAIKKKLVAEIAGVQPTRHAKR